MEVCDGEVVRTHSHEADELLVAARAVGLVPAGGAGGALAVAVRRVAAAVVRAALVAELERARRRAARPLRHETQEHSKHFQLFHLVLPIIIKPLVTNF